MFNESKSYYEGALNKSGYKTLPKYKVSSISINHNNKNGKRRILPTIRMFQQM